MINSLIKKLTKIKDFPQSSGKRYKFKTGIPYVTEGSANSSLKITVECSFPKESES